MKQFDFTVNLSDKFGGHDVWRWIRVKLAFILNEHNLRPDPSIDSEQLEYLNPLRGKWLDMYNAFNNPIIFKDAEGTYGKHKMGIIHVRQNNFL